MHWGRLIGGVVCLGVALVIYVLPADKTMFMVGERNLPLVAVVGLALLGLALLVSALFRRRTP